MDYDESPSNHINHSYLLLIIGYKFKWIFTNNYKIYIIIRIYKNPYNLHLFYMFLDSTCCWNLYYIFEKLISYFPIFNFNILL